MDPRRAAFVYGAMTQAELDAQYDQRTAVREPGAYVEAWQRRSREVLAARPPTSFRYGDGQREVLDLHGAIGGTHLHMHVHGGAWRSLTRKDVAFVATGLGGPGITVAIVDFDPVQEASLARLVDQVRRAFLWSRARATAEGIAVSVSGHSSGAHLAACLLDRTWWRRVGLGAEDFAGIALASGPYGLEPVRLSARNTYLKLSEAEARRLSPGLHLPNRLPRVGIFWGEGELEEFARQSTAFARILERNAPRLEQAVLAGLNHFDVYDSFANPASTVCRFVHTLARPAADLGAV